MNFDDRVMERPFACGLIGRMLFEKLSRKEASCERCGRKVPVLEGYLHGGHVAAAWMKGANWSFRCAPCTPPCDTASDLVYVRADRLLGSNGEALDQWIRVFPRLGPMYGTECLGALLLKLCGQGDELSGLLCVFCGPEVLRWMEPHQKARGKGFDA